jgi:hypothetical protein
MTDGEVTGVLASGGEFHATATMIEVRYPEGDRPTVAIDLHEISGARRKGNEVTLVRRDGREVGLRTTALIEAGRLEALVRGSVESGQAAAFQREIVRLYAQGYRVVAMTPTTAQLVRPKKFNYFIAALLLILAVLPAIIYVFYYLSQSDQTALVTLEDGGQVVTRMP